MANRSRVATSRRGSELCASARRRECARKDRCADRETPPEQAWIRYDIPPEAISRGRRNGSVVATEAQPVSRDLTQKRSPFMDHPAGIVTIGAPSLPSVSVNEKTNIRKVNRFLDFK